MKQKLKAIASPLKFLVAFALIYWLVDRGLLNFDLIQKALQPEYLFVGVLLLGFNIFIVTVRWWVLLRGRGLNLSLREAVPLQFIGMFFNFALPGSVSGDLVKGYILVKENPNKKMAAASTVLMDRVIGLYAMIFLALAGAAFHLDIVFSNKPLLAFVVIVVSIFSGITVFLAMALSKTVRGFKGTDLLLKKLPFGGFVEKVYDTIHSYRSSLKAVAQAFVLSVLAHMSIVVLFYVVGFALNEETVGLGAYFFSVPLGLAVTAIPIAPAGIGVGQEAMLRLFAIFTGSQLKVGPTGATVFQVLLLGWSMLGALFYVKRKRQVAPVLTESELTP
ncbi:MAG: flippase-like domain-containing protein [Pseudobdellovibrionaceae bacterium]|nr:flippase-like domain-containing protein [Bdellovibrionales bacterium]USN46315.1 MAG: flippase-like domain-containing protein [Pseudobdellovibrionaceae bacterium]